MKGKKFTSFLALIGFVFIAAGIGGGCANPIAPSGGPRDSLPPVLVEVYPKDSSENFNEKKVTFYFNEFVQLDNTHDNLVVSPLPKHEPGITSKLKTVTIKINDTLEANTTYSYDFGNALKDINEGNIAKNFTYVFSTGKYIDSLELSGHVIIAQNGKADSTLIAVLHQSGDDSAVSKQRPRYMSKLDNKGNFHFRHLPPGVFYLYALADEGGQKRYFGGPKQFFAFADKPITIGHNNKHDTLYAFTAKDTSHPAAPVAAKPSTAKADKKKEEDKRLKFTMNLEGGRQDIQTNLEFIFAEPLKKFDSSKAQFTNDDFQPISNYTFTKDTSNKKLTLTYKWPMNTSFHLIVDKEFAEDTAGRKIARTDTLTFKTFTDADYGSIGIRFGNLDLTKKPVLQLIQSDVVKFHAALKSNNFKVKLFKPGEYEIRILFDDNNNGVWDTGDFFGKHLQPEKVIPIKKALNVKANWDNDINIEL